MKKSLPLLLLLFLGASNAFSQTFNWSRQMAANGEDWGYAVSTDKARNSYVTGSFLGTITFPTTGCGTFTTLNNRPDIYIAKFNPKGVCLWAKQYGGAGGEQGFSISVDSVGNSYTTGYFEAPITFGSLSIVNQGPSDIFIAKHSPNGTLQWVVRGGSPGVDLGYGIVASGANLYVTGNFSLPITGNATFDSTFGPPCALTNVTPSSGFFIVKYSSGGDCQVAISAGAMNQGGAYGKSLGLDGTGNVYVTGKLSGTAFIAKYDSMLNQLWVKTVIGNARSDSISTDSQGNSYITGVFFGTVTFLGAPSITVTSAYASFIAKYDTTGALKWVRNIGATVTAQAISVRGTCDLFVTGSFVGTANFGVLPPLTSSGGRDIFVTRYDSFGVAQWAIAAGGALEDEGRGISVDSFGKASVTGVYVSNPAAFPGTSPDLTNINTFSRNSFIAKASP